MVRNSTDGLLWVIAPNTSNSMSISLSKSSGETVEERYIYDGFRWRSPTTFQSLATSDNLTYNNLNFSSVGDFMVGGAWKITGQSGYVTCFLPARVFDKVANSNSLRVLRTSFPNSASLEVTDNNKYIGGIVLNESPGCWTGDNKGSQPAYPYWRLLEPTGYLNTFVNGGTGIWTADDTLPNFCGRRQLYFLDKYDPLLTSVRLTLQPPSVFTPIPSVPNMPQSTFILRNLYIYSRSTSGCVPNCPTPAPPTPPPQCDPNCGQGVCGVKLSNGSCYADWGNAVYKLNCCHMACVSNACQYVVGGGNWNCSACQASPTPTPATKVKNPYCVSLGLYPYGPYQDKGGSGNTDNLPNIYIKYVPFVAPFTGSVNGIAVKAGNWGGAQRTVFCKITNSDGTQNISQESDADEFTGSSGAQWRKIIFPSTITLTGGQQYRLYCRGSDTSNMVYWIYDPTKNTNNDLAKLYGRTYSICMQ